MRRSVVIAGIVVVSLAVLPSAAFADQTLVAAEPAQPADCRPAGGDPGGGSGTGDPATGGDQKPADPGTAGGTGGDQSAGDEPDGEKPAGEKPDAEKPAQDGADPGSGGGTGSGEGVADEPPSGDGSGGDKSDGAGSSGDGDQSGGSGQGDDKPDGSGGDKPGGSGGSGDGEKPAGSGDGDKPAGSGGQGDDKSAGSGGDKSDGSGGTGDGDKSGGQGGDQPEDKSGGGSTGDGPSGEKPDADQPSGDAPAGDGSGTAPTGDKPAGDKPAAGGGATGPDDCAAPTGPAAPADPAAPAGAATSAAVMNNWGKPNRVDDFSNGLGDWSLYDGEGHAGNGRRSPEAASTKDGLLTINGDGDGTTAGMAWNPGQKYGRWEGRVKAPASDPTYNALLLLWPDAENFPVGGEVDFMEMTDHTRQKTNLFLHYGEDNSQVQGDVQIDATQWHNWAVEWTPEKITAFVDGKEWWSTTDTSILPPGPMHLCIQLDWFPGNGGGGVKPSEMQVDWVRQYPLPESEQGDAGDKGGDDKSSGDDKGGSEGLLDGVGGALGRLTEGAPDPAGSAQRGPSGVTGTP